MDPGHGRSLVLVLVAALSIGALVPHLARFPSGSLSSETNEPESKASSSAQSDSLEITDLLAEHFQVDVSTNGLKKRVEAALANLSEKTTDRSVDAAIIVRALFCDDNAGDPTERATAWALASKSSSPKPVGCDSPTNGSPDVPAAAVRALKASVDRLVRARPAASVQLSVTPKQSSRDFSLVTAPDAFDGIDKSALVRAVIREAAAGVPIRFLIATVPDPVDSYETWQFDPVVDGLRAAVQDNGYSFDRFVFPEVAADPRAQAVATLNSHRRLPGVLLFSRAPSTTQAAAHLSEESEKPSDEKDEKPSEELLALFLVPETPTAGIHHEPFQRAVKFISAWIGEAGNRNSSLAGLIGPSFSGSSRSLARVLRSSASSLERLGQPTIRVISGNASNFSNKCIIERALDDSSGTNGATPLRVEFRSTVHPNDGMDEAVRELQKHLGMIGRLAEVSEASTSFGQDLRSEDVDPCRPRPSRSEGSLSASGPKSAEPDGEKPLQITVPYNVAQLRAGGGRARGSVSLDAVLPTVRPLPLEDFVSPTDQPTVRTPGTMAAYTELVLRNLIDTIKRENVRAVKIATTDVRDRLYLARELAQRAPDVMVFALDADLFYGHPEQYPWTDGLIVLSSYPLHTLAQLRFRADDDPRAPKQFPNLASQGLYNATVAALNYSLDGTRLDNQKPALVDYTSMPCTSDPDRDASRVPPVWVSVIGRGALVPVKAISLCKSRRLGRDYMFPATQAVSGYWDVAPDVRLSRSTNILLICLAVAAGVASFLGLRYFWRLPVAVTVGAVVASLLIVLTFVWGHPSAIVVVVVLVSIAPVVIARPGRSSVVILHPIDDHSLIEGRRLRRMLATARQQRRSMRWGFLPVLILCAAVWIPLARYLSELHGGSFIELWSLLDIDSGASPLVSMLLIGAVPLIVSSVEMRRQFLRGVTTDPDPQPVPEITWIRRGVGLLDRFILGGLNDRDAAVLAALHGRSLYLPWHLWVVVVVITLVSAVSVFDLSRAPVWSANGVRFGWVIFTGILVVQGLLSIALLQFMTEWQICARLLRGLARHSLAAGFPTVPKEILPRSLFPRRLRLETLKVLIDQMGAFGHPTTVAEHLLDDDLNCAVRPRWLASRTWNQAIRRVVKKRDIPGPRILSQGDRSVVTFLATASVMIVRELMSRLTLSLTMIAPCLAILIGINAMVSFQGSHKLLGLIWVDVIVAIAIVMSAFIQMDRDETLSLVSNTTPGHVDLNIDLLAKVGVYVVLPVLVLFMSQFPGIGSSLRDVLGSVPAFKE